MPAPKILANPAWPSFAPQRPSFASDFPQTPLLDTFVSSLDSSLWQTPWLDVSSLDVSAGFLEPAGAAGGAAAWIDSLGPDCEVYVGVAVLPPPGSALYLDVRRQTLGTVQSDGYELQVVPSTSTWSLRKVILGSPTSIKTMLQPFAAGDSMGVRVVGNTLTVYYLSSDSSTWVSLGSVVDTSFTNVLGHIGLESEDTTQVTRWDNFGGGSLSPLIVSALPLSKISSHPLGLALGQRLFPATRMLPNTGNPLSQSFDASYEATQGIADTSIEPIEAVQSLADTSVEPYEAIVDGIQQTKSDPLEAIIGGIVATQSDPWEALLKLAATASDPYDATKSLRATGLDPWEALVKIVATTSTTESCIDTVGVGSSIGTSTRREAQSFQFSRDGTIVSIELQLSKTGSPTDNVVLELQSDSSGDPSGSVLASASFGAGDLNTGSGSFIRVPLSFSISANTSYWIVIRRSGSTDNSNKAVWFFPTSATYSNGVAKTSANSGSSWSSEINPDFLFRVTLVQPSPYEALQAIASTNNEVWEALQALAATKANPWEALAPISSAKSDIWEALVGIAKTNSESWEAIQGIAKTNSEVWEALQKIAATGLTPWEAIVGGILATRVDSWEALLDIKQIDADPYDALQGIAATKIDIWEATGAVRSSLVLPWEAIIGGIVSTRLNPWEASVLVTSNKAEVWEALLGIASTTSSSWESSGNVLVTQTASLPWDALKAIAGISSDPLDSIIGGIISTRSEAYEALLGIASNKSEVYESLRSIISLGISPWDATGIVYIPVSATGVLPYDVLTGIRVIPSLPLEASKNLTKTASGPYEARIKVFNSATLSYETVVAIRNPALLPLEVVIAAISKIEILPWESGGRAKIIVTETGLELDGAYHSPNFERVVVPAGDSFVILAIPSELMEGLTETGLDIGET